MKKIFLFVAVFFSTALVNAQDLKKVNFDKKFQRNNQGLAKVEIHEVKELLHIMIAITQSGLGNDDMIDQTTPYYKEVLSYFKIFKDEPIILKFDSLMKASPLNYIFLTGNALCYDFNGKKLKLNKNYIFPAQSVSSHTRITRNPVVGYKKQIEDFALKSGFRKFFNSQKLYYSQIINDYNNQANLKKQWEWLEYNFANRVNSYVILTSPLIGGLNYTTSYEDAGFTQIVMVLPPITKSDKVGETENQILNTRFMFTEIDHNYVSAPTKKFEKEINNVFQNRNKWVNAKANGTEYYPTASRVFDEYMTWALYSLYCYDLFRDDEKSFQFAFKDINETMESRGF